MSNRNKLMRTEQRDTTQFVTRRTYRSKLTGANRKLLEEIAENDCEITRSKSFLTIERGDVPTISSPIRMKTSKKYLVRSV